ncbi:YopT-type cysteine protease domain-containing protein [Pantoea sp. SO10]|uniref:YopT-type cysteine protease domain-containing protein n=1 Tax=Pantoea sp. SO10 TaxID=2575375 RepID=UPI0010C9CCDA|nr:YopT-type cysteine protease domain-containing protein [Pantoea sp. SO10]QCP59339.1 hypothetical protein FCN45_08110 [Pantoea sp. SO10]
MPLKLKKELKNYYNYMVDKEIDGGICLGMSAIWLMDVATSGSDKTIFPDTYPSIRMARFYHVISGERRDLPDIEKRLDILGMQLKWQAKGGSFTVKKYNSQVSAQFDIKNYVSTSSRFSFSKGLSLLVFEIGDESSHVVALYKKRNRCYFYDPNVGLYKWTGEPGQLYADLKNYIDKVFTDDGRPTDSRLEAALFFNISSVF